MSETRHTNRSESPTFEELYEQHAERLRRVVWRRAATTDQNREDACSYAWMQLLEKPPSRRPDVFPWLVTVAVRQAWHLARIDRDRATCPIIDDLTTDRDAEAGLVEIEELVEALAQINARRRRLWILHAAGWSYYEIAAEEGISYKRAWQLVERARRELAELLGPDRLMRG